MIATMSSASGATPSLVIYGTGAHARKAYHCWTLAGGLVSYFVDDAAVAGSPVAGVPVLPGARLAEMPPAAVFVAIGRAEVRQRLMRVLEVAGWQLPALVHPRASVATDACLGAGVLVAAGAVVESGSRIERGAIVDIGALVDHDCRVDAFCHLRPGQVCPPSTHWPA